MYNILVIVFATFVFPFIFGWIMGANKVDPNTVEGKIYYDKP